MSDDTLRSVALGAGFEVVSSERLHGGMIGDVHRVYLPNGTSLVAKLDRSAGLNLEREGFMLRYLRDNSTLPVPEVFHSSDELLLMEFVGGASRFTANSERHVAELLAQLHTVTSDSFGLERDTLIGSVSQPNDRSESWGGFFRDQRLLYMADVASNAGRLPVEMRRRIDEFAGRLEEYILEPEKPSLIHGDVWGQNVLASGDRISAFIDPAIYYADAEMELAYISLFDSFGRDFFFRYSELRPVPDEFFEVRRHVYALYPLLAHVYFFGGGYVGAVGRTLGRFGF